jgi:tetratricopeptide (TPR) repeat protein
MNSRFVLLLGFLLSFLIAGVAQQDPHKSAREELNLGVSYYRNANYEEAIRHFNQAVHWDPELTVAHLYLATAYAQQFEPGVDTPENVIAATNALHEYAEVLRRNPSETNALKSMAYMNLQLKDFAKAKESFKKVVELDPTDAESFYSVGVVDWSIAYRDISAEKAKFDAEDEHALMSSDTCMEVRTATLATVDDGIAMLNKAITLRKDYADAMAYMNLLYRLRADVECGSEEAYAADVKKATDWTEQALAARKRIAEAAKSSQDGAADDPPR